VLIWTTLGFSPTLEIRVGPVYSNGPNMGLIWELYAKNAQATSSLGNHGFLFSEIPRLGI